MRRALGLIAALLALAAVVAVGLGAYKLADPFAAQRQQQEQKNLIKVWGTRADPVQPAHHAPACAWPRPANGQPFALMRIPALWGRGQFGVVEGTTLPELATGPGHVIGTSMPGGKNFAVAAHDITAGNPFMHLKSLRKGDKVYVVDKTCRFTYEVTRNPRIVWWTNTSVLRGEHNHHLITLITCTPVTLVFVPHRVIVQGELVNVRSR